MPKHLPLSTLFFAAAVLLVCLQNCAHATPAFPTDQLTGGAQNTNNQKAAMNAKFNKVQAKHDAKQRGANGALVDEDHKPGGKYGPPDESSAFVNTLPILVPVAFLVIVALGYVSLRYFLGQRDVEGSYFDENGKPVARKNAGQLGRTGPRTV